MPSTQDAAVSLPRIAITFCTQCRWMLRAAYFAQELLSTFGPQIGEVALIPATGGLFTVDLTYAPRDIVRDGPGARVATVLLWDRKVDGGFPDTKVLKQKVRDHIDPLRDLGHSDTHGKIRAKDADAAAVKATEGEQKSDGKAKPDESIVQKGTSDRLNVENMDIPSQEVKSEDGGVRINIDGTICEDCN